MANLYKTLQRLCLEKGVSLTKMCEECGFSKSMVTSLKNGQNIVNSFTLVILHNYFGCSVDEILGTNKTTSEDVAKSYSIEKELQRLSRLIDSQDVTYKNEAISDNCKKVISTSIDYIENILETMEEHG